MNENSTRFNPADGFKIGAWEVHPDSTRLTRDGEEEKLEPRAMEVLVFLAERAQQVVKRDELLTKLWHETHGTDEVLSRIISILRRSLGDDSRAPTYIETIPKIGYRLMQQAIPLHGKSKATRPANRLNKRLAAVITLAGLMLVLILLGHERTTHETPQQTASGWLQELLNDSDKQLVTIAVLPFDDLGPGEQNSHFAMGLTDELINVLSGQKTLRVVARRSMVGLRGIGFSDMPEVSHVIAGTVKYSTEQIRVTTQLSDKSGFVIWSGAYDGQPHEFVRLQQSISNEIVTAVMQPLNLSVQPSSATSSQTLDINAYSAYLNGVFLWKLRGADALNASILAYKNALAIDNSLHRSHLGIASSLVLLPYYANLPEAPQFDLARRAISRVPGTALVDPNLRAQVAAINAFIAMREWRWQDAENLFEASLLIDAKQANTWIWYSQLLSAVGRREDALSAAKRAYELDSVSPVVNDRLATAFLWVGEDNNSLKLYQQGAGLGFINQSNPGYLNLMIRLNRWELIQQALPALKGSFLFEHIDQLKQPDMKRKFVAEAKKLIQSGQLPPRLELGLWTQLDAPNEAIHTLRKYMSHKRYLDIEFLFAEEAAALRAHPEFPQICHDLGLTDYWLKVGTPPDL